METTQLHPLFQSHKDFVNKARAQQNTDWRVSYITLRLRQSLLRVHK